MEHIHLLVSTLDTTLRLHITSGLAQDHPPRPRPGRPRPRPAGSRPRPIKTSKSGLDRSRDQDQVSRLTSLVFCLSAVPTLFSVVPSHLEGHHRKVEGHIKIFLPALCAGILCSSTFKLFPAPLVKRYERQGDSSEPLRPAFQTSQPARIDPPPMTSY